jgi:transposase InsO family protein
VDIHKNARLTPRSREVVVERVLIEGQGVRVVARAFGISEKTVRKWVQRFRAEGVDGLSDRSSRPHHSPARTREEAQREVERLRRLRWTCDRIAQATGVSKATVSRVLRRLGLNRLKAIEPAAPVQRYEHDAPGDLLHLDIKKLGKIGVVGHRITGDRRQRSPGIGWEYMHVAIDDHSRIAFSAIHPDECGASAASFLLAAVNYYARLGFKIQRVLTDNGGCYRSRDFRIMCTRLGIRQKFTRPYTPRTNGKAERFIQTALREWAYASTFENSAQRLSELPYWIHVYNWHRPHASLARNTPISRLGITRNNVMRLHMYANAMR